MVGGSGCLSHSREIGVRYVIIIQEVYKRVREKQNKETKSVQWSMY